jgi:hypothetical protein
MRAVQEFALMVSPTATIKTETRSPILRARRVERPTLEEVMADTEKRFARTLAYLAK